MAGEDECLRVVGYLSSADEKEAMHPIAELPEATMAFVLEALGIARRP
jgi:hypothetical protein